MDNYFATTQTTGGFLQATFFVDLSPMPAETVGVLVAPLHGRLGSDATPAERGGDGSEATPAERGGESGSGSLRTPSISPGFLMGHAQEAPVVPAQGGTGSGAAEPRHGARRGPFSPVMWQPPDIWQPRELLVDLARLDAGGLGGTPEEVFREKLRRMGPLSDADMRLAAAEIGRTWVWPMACLERESVLLQEAIETAGLETAGELVVGLHGHVTEAWTSPYVSRVLEKCLKVLPLRRCQFILDEIALGGAERAAMNKYGSRIVWGLINRFPPWSADIMEELLVRETLLKLMTSHFGFQVVLCMLERGCMEQRMRIASALLEESDECVAKIVENMNGGPFVRAMFVLRRPLPQDVQKELAARIYAIKSTDARFPRTRFGKSVVSMARRIMSRE